jgi:hypothetical protein
VKLEQIWRKRRNARREPFVIRVYGQRYLKGPPVHSRSQLPRGREIDVSRRRGKEQETNHIGARVQRDIKRLRGPQAANFDGQAHVSMNSI